MNVSGKRIGIVVSRWNELVVQMLLDGAVDTLRGHGGPETTVAYVPGTWETPIAAKAMVDAGYDGVIVLGCILQGATTHAQMLAEDVSKSLMQIQLESGVPVTWGVLTPETQEQALERAGLKLGNKGREAALAAIEMIDVLGQISTDGQ